MDCTYPYYFEYIFRAFFANKQQKNNQRNKLYKSSLTLDSTLFLVCFFPTFYFSISISFNFLLNCW